MERLTLTEARKALPNILNEHRTVEIDNRSNASIIVPKSEWEAEKARLKQMEKELIQMEHDQMLLSNEAVLEQEDAEKRILD